MFDVRKFGWFFLIFSIDMSNSFFQFWLYAAPAARMSALQGLRVIGIATHDSIGIGEDGPTHQPIA